MQGQYVIKPSHLAVMTDIVVNSSVPPGIAEERGGVKGIDHNCLLHNAHTTHSTYNAAHSAHTHSTHNAHSTHSTQFRGNKAHTVGKGVTVMREAVSGQSMVRFNHLGIYPIYTI